jgi:hypothetical protein
MKDKYFERVLIVGELSNKLKNIKRPFTKKLYKKEGDDYSLSIPQYKRFIPAIGVIESYVARMKVKNMLTNPETRDDALKQNYFRACQFAVQLGTVSDDLEMYDIIQDHLEQFPEHEGLIYGDEHGNLTELDKFYQEWLDKNNKEDHI